MKPIDKDDHPDIEWLLKDEKHSLWDYQSANIMRVLIKKINDLILINNVLNNGYTSKTTDHHNTNINIGIKQKSAITDTSSLDKTTCLHPSSSIEEIQGGQIERCRNCGKTWGEPC